MMKRRINKTLSFVFLASLLLVLGCRKDSETDSYCPPIGLYFGNWHIKSSVSTYSHDEGSSGTYYERPGTVKPGATCDYIIITDSINSGGRNIKLYGPDRTKPFIAPDSLHYYFHHGGQGGGYTVIIEGKKID
ncbi:MAG: hypothetical protein ACKVOR_04045 [Flavobacteriales bacterium]